MWQDVANVMGPKIQGALNLHRLCSVITTIEHFVMFSSVSSYGAVGQGAYAAANCFMDALIQHRRSIRLPGLSINWGPWQEVGMAAGHHVLEQQQSPYSGISTTEAIRLLEKTMMMKHAQYIVAVLKPGGLDMINQGMSRSQQLTSISAQSSLKRGMTSKTSSIGSYGELQTMVQTMARQILQLKNQKIVDSMRPLLEYGLNSVMAVELRDVLSQAIGSPLPATLLFDYPTIKSLTDFLAKKVSLSKHELIEVLPKKQLRVSEAGWSTTKTLQDQSNDICIIGFDCHFGQNEGAEAYWDILVKGLDTITEVPSDRWKRQNKDVIDYGSFFDNIEGFDANFFDIRRYEAELMDPQQRHLLESTWSAFEDAGQVPGTTRNVGVFVGLMSKDYGRLVSQDAEQAVSVPGVLGDSTSVAAARISYVFGFQGPCVVVDTACSSSLVAIHLACQALRGRECDMALGCGVNIVVAPENQYFYRKAGMLAGDGRCKTFDAKADGMVRAEGCGVVILKRLEDAIRDGDHIRAVIRGSAVNQDGKSNGLTAPNGPAQQDVIQRAMTQASIEPHEIDYIEAHGTGTALGDPIEVGALAAVFSGERSQPLMLGSVKTNIGHTEAAAGIASLIKVIMALEHEMIPQSLHFTRPNPNMIPLETIPAQVVY